MNQVAVNKTQALTLARSGRFQEAKSLCDELVRLVPQDSESWYLLAAVNDQLGLIEEAIAAYRRTVALNPRNADACNNLATRLDGMGLVDEAMQWYQQALAADPACAAAHYNYGSALRRMGRTSEAIDALLRSAQLQPEATHALLELASALKAAARFREAIATLEKIIATAPDCAAAHNTLGNILQIQGRLSEALDCYREALRHQPDFAEAYCNIGSAALAQGRPIDAQQAYRKAIHIRPEWAGAHSNLVLTENYHATDGAAMLRLHREWDNRHGKPGKTVTQTPAHRDAKRLRIGYVSPDFRSHSVAYFIEPLLIRHDRSAFEIFCYSDVASPDATTGRLQNLDLNWRNVLSLPDTAVDTMIRRDEIDILVDLAGHTANNRLPLFAMRPAPVQLSYLGYPNTTGMQAMQYRVTDSYADPEGVTDTWHSEKLLRLPNGFLCYAPSPEALQADICERKSNDGICFGSFNNFAKVTPDVIALWSAVLRATPNSKLILKNNSLGDEGTREYCYQQFARHGIDRSTLELRGQTASLAEHLNQYRQIDIALDTFPYNGTTTTFEALWMGVPVVTRCGNLHAGRVGNSILSRLGLAELVAGSDAEFIRIATTLAHQHARLSELHSDLRTRLQNSPLCDAARFTANMEGLYQDIWKAHAARTPTEDRH